LEGRDRHRGGEASCSFLFLNTRGGEEKKNKHHKKKKERKVHPPSISFIRGKRGGVRFKGEKEKERPNLYLRGKERKSNMEYKKGEKKTKLFLIFSKKREGKEGKVVGWREGRGFLEKKPEGREKRGEKDALISFNH